MDIVKLEDKKFDMKKILIVGVEKSGKTSFIGTMPRPILVFAAETGAESRFAGQKDIDVVQCYDKLGELKGAGIRRFEKNFKEILTSSTLPYKTIAIDPLSFLSNYILDEVGRENPSLKNSSNGYAFWGMLKERQEKILTQILGMKQHVVVTSHVKLKDDETTGQAMFLCDLNGSIRDSIGGWFDAVFFTTVKPMGLKAQYVLQAIPDAKKKCGVRVPLGMEDKLSKELPPDYGKIMELLKAK